MRYHYDAVRRFACLQLVEVRLNDAGQAGGGVASPCRSEEELRLVYSALIIRAVNGLTGHEQKARVLQAVVLGCRTKLHCITIQQHYIVT